MLLMSAHGDTRAELFSELALSSGARLRNRVAKAAMEEGMAGDAQLHGARLISLYRTCGAGRAGLLIRCNVMVLAEALTCRGGVVLDDRAPLDPFIRWAQAGKAGGAAMWMQINHPGRQVRAAMPGVVWAPSAVGLALGRHSKRFGPAGGDDRVSDQSDGRSVRDDRGPGRGGRVRRRRGARRARLPA